MSNTLSEIRVDVFRHGHTEGQADRGVYADKGDIYNPLDALGREQVIALSGFMPFFFRSENITKMPMVFIGNRVRVEDTFSSVRYGMEESGFFDGDMVIRPESRFNEKFFGLTNSFQNLINPTPEKQAIANFLDEETIRLHKQDPHRFSHLGGESHVSLYQRVVSGLKDALADARLNGCDHIIIPTSGAVMQCIQQRMGRTSSKGITNPGNCDVHTYIGAGDEWSMRKVYDGEKMKPVMKELKAEAISIAPPTVEDQTKIKQAMAFQRAQAHTPK